MNGGCFLGKLLDIVKVAVQFALHDIHLPADEGLSLLLGKLLTRAFYYIPGDREFLQLVIENPEEFFPTVEQAECRKKFNLRFRRSCEMGGDGIDDFCRVAQEVGIDGLYLF